MWSHTMLHFGYQIYIDRKIDRWIDEWIDRRIDRRTDGQMDGQIDRKTDRQISVVDREGFWVDLNWFTWPTAKRTG